MICQYISNILSSAFAWSYQLASSIVPDDADAGEENGSDNNSMAAPSNECGLGSSATDPPSPSPADEDDTSDEVILAPLLKNLPPLKCVIFCVT